MRATDGSGNGESNTTQRSATPTGAGGGTLTYTSADVPKAIPDALPAGVNSVLTVAGNANTVTDVNVTLNVTHTWDGDLTFTLTPPGLPAVALPIAGGLTFAILVGVWLTSAYWFIDHNGWPS